MPEIIDTMQFKFTACPAPDAGAEDSLLPAGLAPCQRILVPRSVFSQPWINTQNSAALAILCSQSLLREIAPKKGFAKISEVSVLPNGLR